MAAPILTAASTVLCAHGGTATPLVTSPRVKIAGAPAVTISATYTVSGCAFPPPPTATGPCLTGQFLVGAVRVTIGGQPAAIASGSSITTPPGTPMTPAATQSRVLAT